MDAFLFAGWIMLTALIIVLFLLTPRNLHLRHNSEGTNPTNNTANTDPSREPPKTSQQTAGDNSPAVQGVEGDVNIKIEQQRSKK